MRAASSLATISTTQQVAGTMNATQTQHVRALNTQLSNLHDCQKVDWQIRAQSIQTIQNVVSAAAQDASLTAEERSSLLLHIFKTVQAPLNTQLLDLRSTVTRETILTLVQFAQNYPEEFGVHSSKYFSGTDGFLKLLNNGKRLISDMAHEGITQILNAVCIPKVIEVLIVQFKSKNSLVRLRVATYFQIIIKRYDIEFLQKSQKALETDFLVKGVEDQAQDVRKQVRMCWKAYNQVEEFTDRVAALVRDMRGPSKKQLQQELANPSVSPEQPPAFVALAKKQQVAQTPRGPSARAGGLNSSHLGETNQSKQAMRGANLIKSVAQNASVSALRKRSSSKEQAQSYLRAKYAAPQRQIHTQSALQSASKTKGASSLQGSRANTPSAHNQSVVIHSNTTAPWPVAKKGVKHVVANLDSSCCDTSLLNMTTSPQKSSSLKEPTNFSTQRKRPTHQGGPLEEAPKPRYQAVARHVLLNLDKQQQRTHDKPSQSQGKRQLLVPSFSHEAMKQVQRQRRLETVMNQQFQTATVSSNQPSGPVSGRTHHNKRGSSLSSDLQQPIVSTNVKSLHSLHRRGTAMSTRNHDPASLRQMTMSTLSIQKPKMSSRQPQSHSFNKYSTVVKPSYGGHESHGGLGTKSLIRMAARFKKSARMRSPLLGTNEDLQVEPNLEEPKMYQHLQTEVEVQEESKQPGEIAIPDYQPLMTEEARSQSTRNLKSMLFTGNQTSESNLQKTLASRFNSAQRRRRKSVNTGGRIEVVPVGIRPRSISQYHHQFDEQTHQQLIDSAVSHIQQEKMFIGAQADPQCQKRRLSRVNSCQKSAKGSKSARLMFSPRASSRKSRGLKDTDCKSVKSQRSVHSKPDSPIKESPSHIERPSLPTPIQEPQILQFRTTEISNQSIRNQESQPYSQNTKSAKIELQPFTSRNVSQRESLLEEERVATVQSQRNYDSESSQMQIRAVSSLSNFQTGQQLPRTSLTSEKSSGHLGLKSQNSQGLMIKLQPTEKVDFRDALGLALDHDLVKELKQIVNDPQKDSFWQEYTNEVIEFLQAQIEASYLGEETRRQLHLVGKILHAYKHLINFKLKGILLDRIFNLLRDPEIQRLPTHTFSEILSSIRAQNLGWRFFVDSINKLHKAGEADDAFFGKALSVLQGHFRFTQTLDTSLIILFVEQLLVPHFDNSSTIIRKQVVLTLAELKLAMEVRLQTQAALYEVTYEQLTEGKLIAGRQKLVQIYFERLMKETAHLMSQGSAGTKPYYEEGSSSGLLSTGLVHQQNQSSSNAPSGGNQIISDSTSSATVFTCHNSSLNESAIRRTRDQRLSTKKVQR